MNISIVIPNYNGRAILEKHVPAVINAMRPGDELLVVDDASVDDSVSFLRKVYPNIHIVSHKKNQGYAVSCNHGVKHAKHEIVILLNSDVSPRKTFIEPLIKHFQLNTVFAVGCKEENSQGIVSGRSLGRFERGMLIHRRAKDQTKQSTLWAAGGSMAVRKSLWEKIGGMDPLFYPAYQEDRDLSYRALKMGYAVFFEPKSLVFHNHETTNKQELGQRNATIASFKNMFIFFWKNITDPFLLLLHFLWFPYHFIVGGIKTKGLLIVGCIQACAILPKIVIKRARLKNQWIKSDKQVLFEVGDV